MTHASGQTHDPSTSLISTRQHMVFFHSCPPGQLAADEWCAAYPTCLNPLVELALVVGGGAAAVVTGLVVVVDVGEDEAELELEVVTAAAV